MNRLKVAQRNRKVRFAVTAFATLIATPQNWVATPVVMPENGKLYIRPALAITGSEAIAETQSERTVHVKDVPAGTFASLGRFEKGTALTLLSSVELDLFYDAGIGRNSRLHIKGL